jgi:transcriptional regulator with XRE-family HTH domain
MSVPVPLDLGASCSAQVRHPENKAPTGASTQQEGVSSVEYLPTQEELRRRLRAARALKDLTVAQLAASIPSEARLGERTLRKLENGETMLTPPLLRELAARLGLPYTWFTVPDLGAALGGETFEERLSALEAAQLALAESMRGPGRQIRHEPGPRDGDQ